MKPTIMDKEKITRIENVGTVGVENENIPKNQIHFSSSDVL
jgi:hypothetical protein